jgi:hypothetical protein
MLDSSCSLRLPSSYWGSHYAFQVNRHLGDGGRPWARWSFFGCGSILWQRQRVGSSAQSATTWATRTANPQGNIPAALDSIGSKMYPGLYGGLVEVDNGRHIDVYLTSLKPSVEIVFTACRGCQPRRPGDITFIKTAHSLQYLDALHQRVITASQWLMHQGVRLTEWWPQIQDAHEMIGVQGLTRAQTALLERAFGAHNIQVFNVPPSQVPVLTSGRTHDSSPWKGGDAITDFSAGCTSAFAVTIGGKDGLVTAAHCFPTGDSISNENGISGGSGNFIGTVGTRETASGSTDAEVINATSTGYVWTGIPTATTKIAINGTINDPVGSAVYNDGSYSGETDTLHVVETNECITVQDFGKNAT